VVADVRDQSADERVVIGQLASVDDDLTGHAGACFDERPGDCEAYPARRPRHERGLAFK